MFTNVKLELQHMVVLLVGQFTLAAAPCSPFVSPAAAAAVTMS